MVVPDYAQVGCRLETTDGARAVVRYTGAVAGQEGEWVGVEWDDPTRGKHDGSHGRGVVENNDSNAVRTCPHD